MCVCSAYNYAHEVLYIGSQGRVSSPISLSSLCSFFLLLDYITIWMVTQRTPKTTTLSKFVSGCLRGTIWYMENVAVSETSSEVLNLLVVIRTENESVKVYNQSVHC